MKCVLGKQIKSPFFDNSNGLIKETLWNAFLHIPKILIRGNDTRITAVIENEPSVFIGVYGIKLVGSLVEMKEYIVALLNSSLYQYIFMTQNPSLKIGGDFFSINAPQILRLPFKYIDDKTNLLFKELVHQIASVYVAKNDHGSADEQKEIKKCQRDLDQMVYKLYGLTPEEIAIIENSGKA
jgi:hypothetical protein